MSLLTCGVAMKILPQGGPQYFPVSDLGLHTPQSLSKSNLTLDHAKVDTLGTEPRRWALDSESSAQGIES